MCAHTEIIRIDGRRFDNRKHALCFAESLAESLPHVPRVEVRKGNRWARIGLEELRCALDFPRTDILNQPHPLRSIIREFGSVDAALAATLGSDEPVGVCSSCAAVVHGYEPDAEDAECNACGAYAVTGLPRYLGVM